MSEVTLKLTETFDEKGNHTSPILPEGMDNLLIDIDGTICEDIPNEEPERMITAEVFPGAIEQINAWFDQGHIITLFTSRESKRHGEITRTWLKKYGLKYHHLIMDKPRGGRYVVIDNQLFRAVHFQGDWRKVKIEKQIAFPVPSSIH